MTHPAHPTDAELFARFQPIFDRIAAGAVAREQTRGLAHEPVQWLREAGFGAVRVPAEAGGGGATVPQLFRLLVRLGEADSNLVQILRAHFAFVEGRLTADDAGSREVWFPRVVAGDLVGAAMAERNAATETTVKLTKEADGEGWRLDGQKFYCTGTLYADWVSVATVEGDERVSVVVPVTAEGVTRIDDWDGFGQRLTGSGTTRFDNVAVDAGQILRRFALGKFPGDSYLTAYYQLFHLAALAGIARSVLRDAIEFVQGKTRAFGVPGLSSPRTDPLVQRVVGKLSSLAFSAEAIVEAVSAAVERAYQAKLAGVTDEALFVGTDIVAFQGQQISIAQVLEAATLLFEVGGASATSETRRLDRHWRNARTISSHNPAIARERAIGDWLLNGTNPGAAWREGLQKKAAEASEAAADPVPEDEDDGEHAGAERAIPAEVA